jgi:hypothetical protein
LIFSSKNPDPIKAEHLLEEMKDFKRKLHQRNKQIDEYSHKFPTYSTSNIDPSLLGTISIQTSIEHLKLQIDDDNNLQEEEEEINDNESISSNESDQTIQHNTAEQDQEEIKECDIKLENIPNKKLLWSLHFKFVPQYISLYRQSILFASDRWGFVR